MPLNLKNTKEETLKNSFSEILCFCVLVAIFFFSSTKLVAQTDSIIYNGKTTGCIAGNCENGFGVFESPNYRYEGNFINAKANGKGTLIYKDGKRYVGEFLNSEKHGKGIYYFADSSRYEDRKSVV